MNFKKPLRALLTPSYWRGLRNGVVPTIEHKSAFVGRDFATVIDVGANKGQFSLFAAHSWPQAMLHAFEPLPDQAETYRKVHLERSQLHECALGASACELPIHIASRKDSSSLLPLGERQKNMFNMQEVNTLVVPVKRLDCVIRPEMIKAPCLLKIDVQGFEYEVLRGAEGLSHAIDYIFVEASFVELYEGQKLYPEVNALLAAYGFTKQAEFNSIFDEAGNKIQADLMFVRA